MFPDRPSSNSIRTFLDRSTSLQWLLSCLYCIFCNFAGFSLRNGFVKEQQVVRRKLLKSDQVVRLFCFKEDDLKFPKSVTSMLKHQVTSNPSNGPNYKGIVEMRLGFGDGRWGDSEGQKETLWFAEGVHKKAKGSHQRKEENPPDWKWEPTLIDLREWPFVYEATA